MTYTSSEVADLLGVSAATVRNYSSKFAAHLTETARPGRAVRRFAPADIRVLFVASRLMSEFGKTYDQVNEELEAGVEAVADSYDLDVPGFQRPPEPESDEAEIVASDQLSAWLAGVDRVTATLEAAAAEWRQIAEDRRIENEDLREENRRLREELREEQETRRSLWDRLLGR